MATTEQLAQEIAAEIIYKQAVSLLAESIRLDIQSTAIKGPGNNLTDAQLYSWVLNAIDFDQLCEDVAEQLYPVN